MGGSSPVIPSLLVGSYRPTFTTPLTLFPTTFAPLAFLVLCTLMSVIPRRFVYRVIPVSCGPLIRKKLNLISAQIASFLVCYTLVKLGYCIGLQKSILQPSQSVPYLRFDCDSHLQAFRLLPLRSRSSFLLLKR